MPGLLVLVMIVIVAGGAFVLWCSRSRQRTKELAAWAVTKGLTFRAARDRGFVGRFPSLSCLRRGRSRYAYNIAEGDWNGRPVRTFDYHSVTGHGKNRSSHTFSAILLRSNVTLKPLYIRPEGGLDKNTGFFDLADVDFESAEFSREFDVKSVDPQWAHDVIHQQTMEFLLRMPRFSIEFDHAHVIVWNRRRFEPGTFETAIAVAEGLLDNLAEYRVAVRG